ncbi:Uncharacterised protein [Vibrio cholerae]|nr:Uncharacterised protein [Vibrio cholerae]
MTAYHQRDQGDHESVPVGLLLRLAPRSTSRAVSHHHPDPPLCLPWFHHTTR